MGSMRNFEVSVSISGVAIAQAAFHYEAWLTGCAKLSIAPEISLFDSVAFC